MGDPANPVSQPAGLAQAARCGARTRSGAPCRSPAVGGHARCRMHGGKGSGAPRGNRNAWKHGLHSARVRAIARYLRATSPAMIRRMTGATAPAVPDAAPVPPGASDARAAKNAKNAQTTPCKGESARPATPIPAAVAARRRRYSLRSAARATGTSASAGGLAGRWRNNPAWSGMIDRRQSLAALGALLALGPEALAAPARAAKGQPFSWEVLKARAAALARGRARPLPKADPRAHAVDYDAANRISFRPESSLFHDDGYAVRLFPLLKAAPVPVDIWIVERGRAHRIEHSEDMFAVGPGDGPAPHVLPGISGFRVMNRGGVGDWLAFLGASYFRSAGALDQYGLSARGLAIDTGIDGKEEFPVFTSFWLESAGDGLIVHALLESPSVTGAWRFVNRHGGDGVTQDVSMAIWLRKDVERLGIAPLTSMFWYDEGNPQARIDWRPEIHDSDGLLIHNRAGEHIWRPLGNPPRPMVNSFVDDRGASGFGLCQRDRDFDHYQDDGVFYEKRPNLWVEPVGDWGPGAVTLYEIPTRREYEDNIVAFWTPARPARAGTSFAFDYRLRWTDREPRDPARARVVDRWTGTAGRPGTDPIPDARRLVADFEGAVLEGLGRGSGVTASVTVDQGAILSVDAYPVVGRPGRWRLIVDMRRSDRPANLRATLLRGNASLSETLIQQFY